MTAWDNIIYSFSHLMNNFDLELELEQRMRDAATRAANSRGPGGPTWDPFAPRRSHPVEDPLGPLHRESSIGNAPALVPGPLPRL